MLVQDPHYLDLVTHNAICSVERDEAENQVSHIRSP